VSNEAIQMHGGIGVTDELDIGFFLKRARVAEMTFGDAGYHRDRVARVMGY
jgi:alkylation response protein AidB-like acyl-CoA dehydrogenase